MGWPGRIAEGAAWSLELRRARVGPRDVPVTVAHLDPPSKGRGPDGPARPPPPECCAPHSPGRGAGGPRHGSRRPPAPFPCKVSTLESEGGFRWWDHHFSSAVCRLSVLRVTYPCEKPETAECAPPPLCAVGRWQLSHRGPRASFITPAFNSRCSGPGRRSCPGGSRQHGGGSLTPRTRSHEDARAPGSAVQNHGDDPGVLVPRGQISGAGDTRPQQHERGAPLRGGEQGKQG